MPTTLSSVLALDVGEKRVGVAVASMAARLPRPLVTLEQGDELLAALEKIIEAEEASAIVVGLPRGLGGQRTAQTGIIEDFVAGLRQHFKDLPIHLQDEALTSHKAEAELEGRGKDYKRGDIDALAATYILEDWLGEQRELEKP